MIANKPGLQSAVSSEAPDVLFYPHLFFGPYPELYDGSIEMDEFQEQRARKMVHQLERAGTNCGLFAVEGIVVMRCMGEPYTDTPTMFDEIVLQNAIALNLLERRKFTESSIKGSSQCELYTPKRKTPKSGDWIIFSDGSRRKIDGIEKGIAFYGKGNNDLVPCENSVPASNAAPDCWEVDTSR